MQFLSESLLYFFVENENLILKFIWDSKGPEVAKKIVMKKEIVGLIPPNLPCASSVWSVYTYASMHVWRHMRVRPEGDIRNPPVSLGLSTGHRAR